MEENLIIKNNWLKGLLFWSLDALIIPTYAPMMVKLILPYISTADFSYLQLTVMKAIEFAIDPVITITTAANMFKLCKNANKFLCGCLYLKNRSLFEYISDLKRRVNSGALKEVRGFDQIYLLIAASLPDIKHHSGDAYLYKTMIQYVINEIILLLNVVAGLIYYINIT